MELKWKRFCKIFTKTKIVTKKHCCKFYMLIMATTGKTVWVILTEGGRIRSTGVNVPRAVREKSLFWVPNGIERITNPNPWIQLTVGVRVLLTDEQIFPGTIRTTNVVLRINIFAADNTAVELDYHPQVRQAVHGG